MGSPSPLLRTQSSRTDPCGRYQELSPTVGDTPVPTPLFASVPGREPQFRFQILQLVVDDPEAVGVSAILALGVTDHGALIEVGAFPQHANSSSGWRTAWGEGRSLSIPAFCQKSGDSVTFLQDHFAVAGVAVQGLEQHRGHA